MTCDREPFLEERARALKAETHALYLACRDPRTPWAARLIALAVVAYALSPIDLIPDFVPVLGYLDDLLLLPLGIALALRLIPPQVMMESRARAVELAADGRTSWAAAVVVVALWLTLTALAVWWVLRLVQE